MVCYPLRLIADDGPAYDRLVAELGLPVVPWEAECDFENLRKTMVERCSAEHVSLKFPLREMASTISGQRQEARSAGNPGQEQSWRLLGNVLYGVVAGRHSGMGNVVAANVITAAGRAAASCLITALDGFHPLSPAREQA